MLPTGYVREWPFNTGRGSGTFGRQFENKLQPPFTHVKKIQPPLKRVNNFTPSPLELIFYIYICIFNCFSWTWRLPFYNIYYKCLHVRHENKFNSPPAVVTSYSLNKKSPRSPTLLQKYSTAPIFPDPPPPPVLKSHSLRYLTFPIFYNTK